MRKDSPKGYRELEIYELAHEAAVAIHKVTMRLPRFEMFEEGSQIRRSAKSVVANIVEGYGRRGYPAEWYRFLTFAHASCDETSAHLRLLRDTRSLDEKTFDELGETYDKLGRKLSRMIEHVAQGLGPSRATRDPRRATRSDS